MSVEPVTQTMSMNDPTDGDTFCAAHPNGFLMRQRNSECCRCCCCQPNMTFDLYAHDPATAAAEAAAAAGSAAEVDITDVTRKTPTHTIVETSSWCGRTCSYCTPAARATAYHVYAGGDIDDDEVERLRALTADNATGATATPLTGAGRRVAATHTKQCTNGVSCLIMVSDNGPVRCPCCCALPYLESRAGTDGYGGDGRILGTTRYVCDRCLCVPRFDVEDAAGVPRYTIRPDTCCCGVCVRCACCGMGDSGDDGQSQRGQRKAQCCRVPFFIRPHFGGGAPDSRVVGRARDNVYKYDDGRARIQDLWIGLAQECCTRRNMYRVTYPTRDGGGAIDDDMKHTLLGATLLIDVAVFEQQQ